MGIKKTFPLLTAAFPYDHWSVLGSLPEFQTLFPYAANEP
jgi:hypothetical protein